MDILPANLLTLPLGNERREIFKPWDGRPFISELVMASLSVSRCKKIAMQSRINALVTRLTLLEKSLLLISDFFIFQSNTIVFNHFKHSGCSST